MGKIFVPIFIILILSLTLWVYNIENPKTDTLNTPTKETTIPDEWETYSNEKLGISFYYPKELKVEDNGDNSILLLSPSTQPAGFSNFMYFSFIPNKNNVGSIIYNYNDPEFSELKDIPVGETQAVSSVTELEEWYTYTRLENQKIHNEIFQKYENLKPWEFPAGTKEIRNLLEKDDIRYLVGAYTTEEAFLNEKLISEILATIKFKFPENETLQIETLDISLPQEWDVYEDPTYGLSISYPSSLEITPAPTEGYGGLIRFQGEYNEELIWIEVGYLFDTKREPDETLREVEHRRSPDTKYTQERMIKVNDMEIYQQVVPLVSGGGANPKTHGIFNLFEFSGKLYFAEIYTNNADKQLEFITQFTSAIKPVSN